MARRATVDLAVAAPAACRWPAGAGPLRRKVGASVGGPGTAVLDLAAWGGVLPRLDPVVVDPPAACLPRIPGPDWRRQVAVQVRFMAAQAGVLTNTLAAACVRPDCAPQPLTPRSLLVRLNPDALPPAGTGLTCRWNTLMAVCRMAGAGGAALAPLPGEAPSAARPS